jgi:hypothetical protein
MKRFTQHKNLPHIYGWLSWIHKMAVEKRPLPQIAASLLQMMPELNDAGVTLAGLKISLEEASIS